MFAGVDGNAYNICMSTTGPDIFYPEGTITSLNLQVNILAAIAEFSFLLLYAVNCVRA